MPDQVERPQVWMQCPGCWSASLCPAPTEEIYIECDCGEKLTVIDLRDGGHLTVDRGSLEDWGATEARKQRDEELRERIEKLLPANGLLDCVSRTDLLAIFEEADGLRADPCRAGGRWAA